MHIEWVVICRYAESDGGRATIIGAGTDVIFAQQLPGPVGIMAAVRLAAAPDELGPGNSHTLSARVLRPDGDPATLADGDEAPPLTLQIETSEPVQQLVPGWLVNPMMAFRLEWWATDPGTYSAAMTIDDGEPLLTPVHVLHVDDRPGA